jgi:UDP-N-acetylmuramyl pentapeptide phosphotransferase/UDP-N-acetylglucosamine-1-phosphate transferase
MLVFVGAAVVGTLWMLAYGRMRGHVAVPNERSSHVVPTPKSGGVGIVFGIFAGLLWVHAGDTILSNDGRWFGAALAGGVACLIGWFDDVRGLRPIVKLGLCLAAACLAMAATSVSVVRGLPFAGDLHLAWAAWPLGLFWLSCFPQAFNFMDGIDGIASLTAIVSGAVYVVAGERGGGQSEEVAAAIALATVGFLPFNFPRARIFMGDAGSLPLGLLLAWCAIEANATGALPLPASILLLGPFLFDVTFTLFRRWREGKTIGAPHKEHLYQRLSRVWDSHAKVSLLYAGFSVATGVLALNYAAMTDLGKLLSLVLPTVAMLGFAALVLRAERAKGR